MRHVLERGELVVRGWWESTGGRFAGGGKQKKGRNRVAGQLTVTRGLNKLRCGSTTKTSRQKVIEEPKVGTKNQDPSSVPRAAEGSSRRMETQKVKGKI